MVVLGPGRWRLVAAALAAGLSLVACGSSTPNTPGGTGSPTVSATPASPTPGASSAVCKAATDLRDSVTALTHIKNQQNAINEVRSGLADVESKLNALTAQLHNSLQPQTTAVTSAFDTLKTAVSNLGAQPSASAVTAVVTAAGGLTTAVRELLAALPQCGSDTASPSS